MLHFSVILKLYEVNMIANLINKTPGSLIMSFLCFFLASCYYFYSCTPKIIKPSNRVLEVNSDLDHEINNFVFLTTERHLVFCEDDDAEAGTCDEITTTESSASGVVISSTRSHIFILTASHFCTPENDLYLSSLGEKVIRAYIGPSNRVASIVLEDKRNDLCLLQALKKQDEVFKKVKIADHMPAIGDPVVNVAAPSGIASAHTKLVFDGHFGGCEDIMCIYTIPSTFGSSGSAVYNERGELISILVAAAVDFENVGMGPGQREITNFLISVDNIIDIY